MNRASCAVFLAGLALGMGPGGALAEAARPKPRPQTPAFTGDGSAQIEEGAAQPPAPDAPAISASPGKGPVTNLPLPRYVSLKGAEGNARRGPGLTHRIDWVFTQPGMPLRITAEHEHWRRVEDSEGLGGWVHYSLLSGARTVMTIQDMTEFHARPDAGSDVVFKAQRQVIARLLDCQPDWCRVSAEGEKGWAPKAALWGVDPGEVVE